MVFSISGKRYGLPIEQVEQIVPRADIAAVPGSPSLVLGVFTIRGATLPVVDTPNLLGLPAVSAGLFLIVNAGGHRLAHLVDAVEVIETVSAEMLSTVGEAAASDLCSHCAITNTGIVILLDGCQLAEKVESSEPALASLVA